MPGNASYLIDPASFTTAILLGVEPRLVFGSNTGEHELTKGDNPLPKWTAQVVVTFPPANGMPAASDIISVTIAAATNPGDAVTPGTMVAFDQLRVGISAPEIRQRKDSDQQRVTGGKPFFAAAGIHAAASTNGHRPFAEAKAD